MKLWPILGVAMLAGCHAPTPPPPPPLHMATVTIADLEKVDIFSVYRGSGAENLAKIGQTTGRMFIDNSVTTKQTYCYAVTASVGAKESSKSNVACTTIP